MRRSFLQSRELCRLLLSFAKDDCALGELSTQLQKRTLLALRGSMWKILVCVRTVAGRSFRFDIRAHA